MSTLVHIHLKGVDSVASFREAMVHAVRRTYYGYIRGIPGILGARVHRILAIWRNDKYGTKSVRLAKAGSAAAAKRRRFVEFVSVVRIPDRSAEMRITKSRTPAVASSRESQGRLLRHHEEQP